MAQPLDTTAIGLYNALIAGETFTVPVIDVSGPEYDIPGGSANPAFGQIPVVTNASLTDATANSDGKTVTGTGAMDVLMNTFVLHLEREYKTGRITGAEYTKAYIASCQYAAQGGIQFLLQKDQSYWQAVTAQMGLITGRVSLAIAQTQLANAQIEANTAKVNYALTKAKIATENAGYISVSEQGEAQRAQTMDTRSDGSTIVGLLGKQKALYDQQITSYKRDAEVKAGKLWIDAWITMKTIDEGLLPPDQFTNTEINEVLATLKTNNLLGSA
jgi:hypothetical protein